MTVTQPNHVSTDRVVPIVLADATSMAVTMPSGYLEDDVLLVTIETSNVSENGLPTAPTDWLMLDSNDYTFNTNVRSFYKYATGSEGGAVAFPLPPPAEEGAVRTGEYVCTTVAYRDAADYPNNVAMNASGAAVANWTSPTYSAVVPSRVVSMWGTGDRGGVSGLSADGSSTNRSANLTTNYPFVLDRLSGPGTTSGTTLTRVSGSSANNFFAGAITIGLRPANSAPYAPTLVTPASGQTIAVGATNRFYWTFNDPDFDLARAEGQSKYEIRYRVVGAPSWTTLTPSPTTNQYHDFAGATFTTATNYEWQVRCYDLAVEVGPWSSSGFFTGGTAPATPTIDSPTLNEEMDAMETLAWTGGTKTAYQYRKVADNGGSPDTSIVYFNSGTVPDPAATTAPLTFPVNNRFEHVQLREFDGTLWSDWASVRVEASYTPPPAPVVTLSTDASTANLVINWETPAPVGDQPTPTYVQIEIDDGGDFVREVKRGMDNLPLEGSVTHNLRSGRDYETNVWVISYTADGIPSE